MPCRLYLVLKAKKACHHLRNKQPSVVETSQSAKKMLPVTLLLLFCLPNVQALMAQHACTANYCAQFGAKSVCTFTHASESRVLTCAQFATTEQSREQCSFACIQICLPLEQQPRASDGKRYCSPCILKSASCASAYKLYFAPSIQPTPSPDNNSINPLCSLPFCTHNGSNAKCLLQTAESTKRITCAQWPSLDKHACPRYVCKIFCPLPKKGPVCNNFCPPCAFNSLSCESNFTLYAPNNCISPTPKPTPPACSLKFCSTYGSSAACNFRKRNITCAQWPILHKHACPNAVCFIHCFLPPTGPVCNNTCPPCAFYYHSCETRFKLFAPPVCPTKGIAIA